MYIRGLSPSTRSGPLPSRRGRRSHEHVGTFDRLLDVMRAIQNIEQEAKAKRLHPPKGMALHDSLSTEARDIEAAVHEATKTARQLGREDLLPILDRIDASGRAKLLELEAKAFDPGAAARFDADATEFRREQQKS